MRYIQVLALCNGLEISLPNYWQERQENNYSFLLSVKFPVSDESPIKGKENCPKPKRTMMGF